MSSTSKTAEQRRNRFTVSVSESLHIRGRSFRFNSPLKWSAYALIGLFCIYRLAVFKPLPLDSPGTLRPILYSLFNWFVGSGTRDQAFASWSTICSFVLFVPAGLAILYYGWRHGLIKLPRPVTQVLCSRWLFFTAIAICLLLCRFPTLLQDELNPDEGAFIAAAFKLFYDPNYFHAVDCATNGPLNIFPLMLPAIFGFSPDFASSRLLAIVIVLLCAFLFYRSVALIAPEELARFAILPFVGAMAVFNNTELRHYSSEYVPMLLIAATLYLSVRVLHRPVTYRVPTFLMGILCCAAFFAKIQSVPVVLSLAVVAIAYVYAAGYAVKRWRPALLFVAGLMPLMLINAVLCLSAGVSKDFWISYIRANLHYADNDSSGFIALLRPFTEFLLGTYEVRFFLFIVVAAAVAYLLTKAARRIAAEHEMFVPLAAISALIAAGILLPSTDGWAIYTYLVVLAIFMTPVYFAVSYSRSGLGLSPVGWFGCLALASSAAAFFSVYRAHRPFVHYLLFLFLPLSAALAWMLIRQAEPLSSGEAAISGELPLSAKYHRGVAFLGFVLALIFAYQAYVWSFQDNQWFKKAAAWIRPGEGDFVRSVTTPGPTIFVWGWNVRPYLGSGRVTATRDLTVSNCFRSYNVWTSPPIYSPNRQTLEIDNYYQQRVVRDLRANPPELFIDAMSPGSWFINDRRYFGFQRIPELNDFVTAKYTLFGEMFGQRYYLRRDLLARERYVAPPKTCTEGALTCLSMPARLSSRGILMTEVHDLPPVQLPAHALLQAQFTPEGAQTQNATIFNQGAQSDSFHGLRFLNIGGRRYRLILGTGSSWSSSKPVLLPEGKPALLSIELSGSNVHMECNGKAVDDIRLPSPVVEASGPINVGASVDGKDRFSGAVQFFQLMSLEGAK